MAFGSISLCNGAGTTLTGEFWANAMLWQLGVLAYNLSIWLRRLTDTGSWRQEPRTFREWFIPLRREVGPARPQLFAEDAGQLLPAAPPAPF